MHMDLNKLSLLGRLVTDPAARGTATVFRMVTNYTVTGKQRTDYHTVVSFGTLAQVVARYLRKGDRIYVEGRLHSIDPVAKSGERRRTVEVIAQHVIMLGGAEPKRSVVVQQ